MSKENIKIELEMSKENIKVFKVHYNTPVSVAQSVVYLLFIIVYFISIVHSPSNYSTRHDRLAMLWQCNTEFLN